MEGERSGIPRSSDRTRRDEDGGEEDERCIGVADTKVCQGCVEILRIGELLSSIH